jgi:hypothetical protein
MENREHEFVRASQPMKALWGADHIKIELGTNPDSGLPRVATPARMVIDFDEQGGISSIQTTWTEKDAAGQVYYGHAPVPMVTNAYDRLYFRAGFGPLIIPSILNGYIRRKWNYQPLYDAAGLRIADSVYNTTAPASNDYQTHNADGTPIDPSGEVKDTSNWKV